MNKEKLFEIDIDKLDDPFEREKFEMLPKEWLIELLVRHLKKEIKVINYINTSIKPLDTKILNEKEINELLNILGDTNE